MNICIRMVLGYRWLTSIDTKGLKIIVLKRDVRKRVKIRTLTGPDIIRKTTREEG